MARTARFIVITLIAHTVLNAQNPGSINDISRLKKTEDIFKIQDSRIQHSDNLVTLLSDPDAHVRMLAVRSLGSIQDTSMLSLLTDRFVSDPDLSVRYNAAFAIGQTAAWMSTAGRMKLGSVLIHFASGDFQQGDPQTDRYRMIEEIGKFGTADELRDIIDRFGKKENSKYREAVAMSVARFAIRGIKSDQAVDYLIGFVNSHDSVSWKIVYALQRIGDHQQIRSSIDKIICIHDDPDPLVRINLAVLAGNVRNNKACASILLRYAGWDPDWRVRVSAFNALGRYDTINDADIISTYLEGFSDKNYHVAEAAIRSYGNAGFARDPMLIYRGKALDMIANIAMNKNKYFPMHIQAEAISAVAKQNGEKAFDLLISITDPGPVVQAQIAEALGRTGAKQSLGYLLNLAGGNNAVISSGALAGLQELSKNNPNDPEIKARTYEAAISALGGSDIAVISASAGILGDSIFIRDSSADPLVAALKRMKIPDDVEAIQAVLQTLGVIKSVKVIEEIRNYLSVRDRSVQLAAKSALHSITGERNPMSPDSAFEPIYTDYDFNYYRGLPDTIRVNIETSRGNLLLDLYKECAPFTVISFLKLATQKKFFNGTIFHRVVPNFVIQGGDPRGDGWGGPGYSLRSEFSPLTYETGSVGMASAGMDTEGSQFFITHSHQPHLDGRYTIFGKFVGDFGIPNAIMRGDTIRDIKIVKNNK